MIQFDKSSLHIILLAVLGLVGCGQPDKGAPTLDFEEQVHTEVPVPGLDIESKDVTLTEAVYSEIKTEDVELDLSPGVSCTQSALTGPLTRLSSNATRGPSTLVVTCNLIVPGAGPLTMDRWPTAFEWFFEPSVNAVIPTIDTSTNNGITARFTFTHPETSFLLYSADTGKFGVAYNGRDRRLRLADVRASLTGQSCREPVPGVINFYYGEQLTRTTNPELTGGSFGGAQAGESYTVSINSLFTDSVGARIVGFSNVTVNYSVSGGKFFLFDSSTLVGTGAQDFIVASPYATIKPIGVSPRPTGTVLRFRSEFAMCLRAP